MVYEGDELRNVLEIHKLWVESDHLCGERALFQHGDVIRSHKDIFLPYAMMKGVIVIGTMSGANLEGAILNDADLSTLDFSDANLQGASLIRANMEFSDFCDADFKNASISRANIYGAKFEFAQNLPYIPMVCPDTGSFIGWKKCYIDDDTGIERGFCLSPVIVKLRIPWNAKRSSATSRKCRASRAIVVEIQGLDGEVLPNDTVAYSGYDSSFEYKVGCSVKPRGQFDTNRWIECSEGIHFFMNREEAVDY